jgi:hypothetical protein
MKPITETEYIDLIDENENSKTEFSTTQVNKLKDTFISLMKNHEVKKHLLKVETTNSILMNIKKDSIEVDKFKSSFLVAINTTKYSYHYKFKTFKSIVENLNDLTQHSLSKKK